MMPSSIWSKIDKSLNNKSINLFVLLIGTMMAKLQDQNSSKSSKKFLQNKNDLSTSTHFFNEVFPLSDLPSHLDQLVDLHLS